MKWPSNIYRCLLLLAFRITYVDLCLCRSTPISILLCKINVHQTPLHSLKEKNNSNLEFHFYPLGLASWLIVSYIMYAF